MLHLLPLLLIIVLVHEPEIKRWVRSRTQGNPGKEHDPGTALYAQDGLRYGRRPKRTLARDKH